MILKLLTLLRSDQLRTTAASMAASWGVATLQQDLAGVLSAHQELDTTLADRQADLAILEDTIAGRRRQLADLDGQWLHGAEATAPEVWIEVRIDDGEPLLRTRTIELAHMWHLAGGKPGVWIDMLGGPDGPPVMVVPGGVRLALNLRVGGPVVDVEPLPVRPDPDPARRAFEATESGDYEEVTTNA